MTAIVQRRQPSRSQDSCMQLRVTNFCRVTDRPDGRRRCRISAKTSGAASDG